MMEEISGNILGALVPGFHVDRAKETFLGEIFSVAVVRS
jgi:hypothetical protein